MLVYFHNLDDSFANIEFGLYFHTDVRTSVKLCRISGEDDVFEYDIGRVCIDGAWSANIKEMASIKDLQIRHIETCPPCYLVMAGFIRRFICSFPDLSATLYRDVYCSKLSAVNSEEGLGEFDPRTSIASRR